MVIRKAISFPNVKSAVKFVRPIIDEMGNSVRNCLISNNCELYEINEWNSHNYCCETKQSDIKIYTDKNGRKYASINDNSKDHKRRQHLARIAKRAFDNPKYQDNFYKTHQIDHINPSVPVSNDISNLEWVTAKENMYRAGKTGVMQKKYSREIVNIICQKIINGERRVDIARELNVDIHLVDDILSGKSHRSISEKYIDKGFKYREKRDKESQDNLAEKICKLIISTNKKDSEIGKLLNCDRRMVHAIRIGFAYRHISKKYGIINE